MKRYRTIITVAVAGLLFSACSGTRPGHLGIQGDGRLAPCPNTPNCVSSFAAKDDSRHYIAPIDADEGTWQQLEQVLEATPRIEIITRDEHYLRAAATTRILRFVDDLEFLYQPAHSRIDVRSASRIGRSDFGVNRKRIERIREQLDK